MNKRWADTGAAIGARPPTVWYTRSLTDFARSITHPPAPSTFTAAEARRFAAMILEAADELDRLAEVEVF